MAKEIYELDVVAADNNFAPALGGFPEGMARSDVNNGLREHLASLRRFYNDSQWIRCRIQGPGAGDIGVFTRVSANQFTITLTGVDLSSYFTDKRVILIKDGLGLGSDLVTQCNGNATYLANVTTVNTAAAMDVAATDAYTHSNSVMRKQALLEDRTDFYVPATADSAGIQAQIDAASAAGGGIILLTQPLYVMTTQVDITGIKGDITILGAGTQTSLQRAGNSNAIINFDNANKALTIIGVKFDANAVNYPVGNGYGFNLNNCESLTLINCEFDRCNHGVNISGSNCKKISISECAFKFFRYGVVTNGVNDTHEGQISGCVFDGALISGVTPASMKLSGSWRVTGNTVRNYGTAATSPIGIWIWDKTSGAPANGGFNSSVVGNEIKTGQVTGTAIWMGADDGTCVGNVVQVASSGIGILVGSVAAGQFAERIEVHGNSIRQGSRGITLLENSRHASITGNSIRPTSGTCIEVSGDTSNIQGNICHRDAVIGIDLLSTAVGNSVKNNLILDVTTSGIVVRNGANANEVSYNQINGALTNGVLVEATALDTRVLENSAPNIAEPLTNSSTSTRHARNKETLHAIEFYEAGKATTAAEVVYWNGELPEGGGLGTYRFETYYKSTGSTLTYRVRVGPLNTIADPVVSTIVHGPGPLTTPNSIATDQFFTITSATDRYYQLTLQRGGGGTDDVGFRLTKLTEPLG